MEDKKYEWELTNEEYEKKYKDSSLKTDNYADPSPVSFCEGWTYFVPLWGIVFPKINVEGASGAGLDIKLDSILGRKIQFGISDDRLFKSSDFGFVPLKYIGGERFVFTPSDMEFYIEEYKFNRHVSIGSVTSKEFCSLKEHSPLFLKGEALRVSKRDLVDAISAFGKMITTEEFVKTINKAKIENLENLNRIFEKDIIPRDHRDALIINKRLQLLKEAVAELRDYKDIKYSNMEKTLK